MKIGEASRPYVISKAVTLDDDAAVVRAPARVSFRDGALSQVNLPVTGHVVAVHVATGDKVKAGDPLITLTSPDAAAARASAKAAIAEHDAAAKEYQRQSTMATSGVGIDSERVAAEAHMRQTEAELARAQTTVALLGSGGGSTIVLRAPIAGTIIARRATVGSVAQPGGESLIDIGNPAALWIVAEVFERDLMQVHEGADVDIELASGDKPVHGKVASIGSALTGSMRTAPVYIALDGEMPDARSGMYARASIKSQAGKAIVLPSDAVLIKDGKNYIVYVKSAPDTYVAKKVSVGHSIDGKVQILSGLTVGDQVVIKGALLLDGEAEQLL
ncbi:MAG TPA: efflux RND transporter periplasmic adaptor subunit [Kofleriaceae bacterium]